MGPNRQERESRWKFKLGACGLMLALGGALLLGVNSPPLAGDARSAPPPEVASADNLSAAFRYAAGKVLPSVVTIRTEVSARREGTRQPTQRLPEGIPEEMQPFFKRFFGEEFDLPRELPRQAPRGPGRQGMGSGVIIDPSGIILTNNHVVRGGNKVIVRLHDGREFEAVDVKTDPKTDIAVLRIEGAGELPAAAIGDSENIEIGDWVLAVGAPFGLDKTVTAGIISAKARGVGITEREEFLQTDAAINPGNSGGPLVNLRGEIVGINTAISTRGGGNDGVGFAVPVHLAEWVSRQLIETGSVRRAFLGVGIQQVTSDLSKQFGLTTVEGAVVTEVRPDTAAAAAGVEPGDVIVEFSGHAVNSPRELQNVVERSEIGNSHELVVIRDGRRKTLKVTLQPLPENLTVSTEERPVPAKTSGSRKFGIDVSELTADVAEQLSIRDDSGVVIVSVEADGAGERAGLQEGMVISRVGRKQVRNLEDFEAAMKDADPERGVLLLVRTGSGSRFVVLGGN